MENQSGLTQLRQLRQARYHSHVPPNNSICLLCPGSAPFTPFTPFALFTPNYGPVNILLTKTISEPIISQSENQPKSQQKAQTVIAHATFVFNFLNFNWTGLDAGLRISHDPPGLAICLSGPKLLQMCPELINMENVAVMWNLLR